MAKRKTIFVERVEYGKDSTPVEDREYVLAGTKGPVGTINEWISCAFAPIIQETGKRQIETKEEQRDREEHGLVSEEELNPEQEDHMIESGMEDVVEEKCACVDCRGEGCKECDGRGDIDLKGGKE